MKASPDNPAGSLPFLLAQVGAHAAMKFAERLERLDLSPPHAGLLGMLRRSGGQSQQDVAEALGMHPSRMVALVDELESKGLIERRANPDDRRVYALFLTPAGEKALRDIGRVNAEHLEALCEALDPGERVELASLLSRIARQQGLRAGVHPGFARIGRKGKG
ncbi:MAG TPA: MarR family transcriptional regulator [Polyangiaceae bacterium]|jgi:DNA-binding MarR family transcriptional regulator|nr:MarR family transcriptional regulator [Polyangiaceae bacterium]